MAGKQVALVLGLNQPCAIEDQTDWFIQRRAEPRGLAHSPLEVRNGQLRDSLGGALGRPSVGRDRLNPGACFMTLTRNIPLEPVQPALLFFDVQNVSAHPKGAEFSPLSEAVFAEDYGWYFSELDMRVDPKMEWLRQAARAAGIKALYTTTESFTLNGHDRSRGCGITGFHVPKGSRDGKVIALIDPSETRSCGPRARLRSSSRPISTTCCAISSCASW